MFWVIQESLTRNNGTELCREYIQLSTRQSFLAGMQERDHFILGRNSRKGTSPRDAGSVI